MEETIIQVFSEVHNFFLVSTDLVKYVFYSVKKAYKLGHILGMFL